MIRQSVLALGRALPLGIGLVIGAVGNLVIARAVIRAADHAFGPLTVSRVAGTRSPARVGRRRPPIGLSVKLITAEVAATATRPSAAARRPDAPEAASSAAAANHSLEWFAAWDSAPKARSKLGVGVPAIARNTVRSRPSSCSRSPGRPAPEFVAADAR